MRVAFLSYPMLLQRIGGLQIQFLETCKALRSNGVDARLFDLYRDRLTDFDIVHVFGAINGNHRILEEARSQGRRTVLSSVLHPPWHRRDHRRATRLGRLVGRLSRWQINTSYDQLQSALRHADRIVALGEEERRMLIDGYGQPAERIAILPNGIAPAMFAADERAFREHTGIEGPYALSVATVSPYKGQLNALRACLGRLPLVVIGPCKAEFRPYLEALQDEGGDQLHYLGALRNDDPLLASAHAGASLFLLPSQSEVQPIAALEALAAGTPVVVTERSSLDLPASPAIAEVDPDDIAAIRRAIDAILAAPPGADACRERVRDLSWERVTGGLVRLYHDLLPSQAR